MRRAIDMPTDLKHPASQADGFAVGGLSVDDRRAIDERRWVAVVDQREPTVERSGGSASLRPQPPERRSTAEPSAGDVT